MGKVVELFRKMYEWVVTLFMLGILVFLIYLSSRTTAVLMQSEHLLFIRESLIFFFAVILASFLFVFISVKNQKVSRVITKINSDDDLYRILRKWLAIGLFGVCLFWVLNTQMIARADQIEIQEAAFRIHLGDFGELLPDGYIGAHSNQMGLMLLSYWFSFIFGSQNYLVFQIINCIAVSVIYLQLAGFGAVLKMNNFGKLLVQVSGFFFFPIIFFTSFVYGNLIGLALSLCAINLEYAFFEKREMKYGILSAFLIALAAMVKPNFSIFMIGMLIYGAIAIVLNKSYKTVYYLALILVFFCIQSFGTRFLFEKMSGIEMGDGISPYAFAAMGLQEGGLGPGWYDGYNDLSYEMVKYDTHEQRQMAIWNIKDRLKFFADNKDEAISFFTRKTAAQWVEPTYESLFILNEKSDYAVKYSGWVWFITTVYGGAVLTRFGKVFQIIVLAGALLYLMLVRRTDEYYQKLTLFMLLIGGFVFHFVWEANGQYTILFFILLIPYAVCGYKYLRCTIQLSSGGNVREKINIPVIVIAAVLVIVFSLFYHGRSEYLTADSGAYKDYVANSKNEVVVPDGKYSLSAKSGKKLTAVPDTTKEYSFDDDERCMHLILGDEGTKVKVVNYHGRVRLYLLDKNLYLQHDGDEIKAADYKDTVEQLFFIRESLESGKYYIIPCRKGIDTFDERKSAVPERYLGYDKDGNIIMTDDENSIKWEFIK